ncbi:MAG: SH3 domain-containing protein, partial [Blastochloris sp.]|nr:SH3 domain-containing protein [Blastochloris sp.]
IAPVPTLRGFAGGTVNVRDLPQADADIIEQVGLRTTLTINGRTPDASWLRAVTPSGNIGWVAASGVTLDGAASTIESVAPSADYYRGFQVVTFEAASDDSRCDGEPDSGLLIQGPPEPVEFILNDARLVINGTVYLQDRDDGGLNIYTLEGSVEFGFPPSVAYIPAGVALTEGSVQPYDATELDGLPLYTLPRRVSAVAPLTADELARLQDEWANPPAVESVPAVVATQSPRCAYIARRNADLRAGPGDFYEVTGITSEGARLAPLLQANDADGQPWYQLPDSRWIRADLVEQTGVCAAIPFTNVALAPPTNTMRLETCAPENGPLREGQRVTITFTPPGWDTYYQAERAPYVAPAQIVVDTTPLRVTFSDVIPLTQTDYIRVFRAEWTAAAGSHRISGDRLEYNPLCNVTVPIG